MSDKSVTIEEANDLKNLLEEHIAESVVEFQRKTELKVVNIELAMLESGEIVVAVAAML